LWVSPWKRLPAPAANTTAMRMADILPGRVTVKGA